MNINSLRIALFVLLMVLSAGVYAVPQTSAIQSAQITEQTQDGSILYTSRASLKFMQKDMQGAISELDKAIQVNPNNPMLYLNRGYVRHVLNDLAGAMEDYNQAIKANPKCAEAYNNRGVLKISLNDINGAIEDYAAALTINKRYSDVYYNRGNLKYMLNDNEGALADYNKAIELNPKDSEAYNNRGVVKRRMNYNVGALSDYSQAIALNPKDSIAYSNRGKLKKLYFDNEGAAIDLNQAVALAETQTFIKNVKPLLSNEHYIAAVPVVNGVTNNPPMIKTTPKVALKPDKADYPDLPKSKIASMEKSTNLRTADDTKQKIGSSEMLASSKVPVGTISASIGTVKIADANIIAQPVTKAPTTNKKLAESYYIRGLQKCVLHDLRGAISDLDKAIANDSKYADAYFYRGAIKKELGDNEGFKKDYTAAIQMNPNLQQFNDKDALALVRK